MANEKQANVKFDDATYEALERCSKLDFDRGVAGIIRRLVKKGLPTLEAELAAQAAAPRIPTSKKYAVPGQSNLGRGQRAIPKKREN